MSTRYFNKGYGSIVGSYFPIEYNDTIYRINAYLTKTSNVDGRHVTAAFWIVDKDFNINNLNFSNAKFANSINPKNSKVLVDTINRVDYVNTNTIKSNVEEEIEFYFNYNEKIEAKKIFFAFISTPGNISDINGYDDYYTHSLSIPSSNGTGLYYSNKSLSSYDVIIENGTITDNGYGIKFGSADITHVDNIDEDDMIPSKIFCTELKYRTWSSPRLKYEIADDYFNSKYLLSYADGGEHYGDLKDAKNEIIMSLPCNHGDLTDGLQDEIITYIDNSNGTFQSTFGIPKGRLNDVTFSRPDIPEFVKQSDDINVLPEPRWVFKRSRIMFTIPPVKLSNGSTSKNDIIIRYKVETAIFDENYSANYKQCIYRGTTAQDKINLVICPRDEGVLDNMSFRVVLSRKYTNTGNDKWSDEVSYYFHTFQQPTVNIAYPKIIRNKVTEENNNMSFKWAKIITSNMYSNFNGEDALVNKYVCDALNVMLATPKSDDSGIPQFVRFYLAEFKYGRKNYNTAGNKFEWSSINSTLQDLFRSDNQEDYTTLEEILKDDANKRTANMTNVFSNDGAPILLSGKFSESALSNIGKEYDLWTYRTWDKVYDENDPLVKNTWPYVDENGKHIAGSSEIIGDHKGVPKVLAQSGNTPTVVQQDTSEILIFRAGYVYLLRARMFHGAAAGAIGAKYYEKNSIIYGDANSGTYDYTGLGGEYPYVKGVVDDTPQHGDLHPFGKQIINGEGVITYEKWVGADDGTGMLTLSNDDKFKLNQTYPGFSEVDYTIIEPVCPYTSRNNLITVHPTSSEIGANQWVTFNYRHLNKNIGGIDTYSYDDSSGNPTIVDNSFGLKNTGIQNTITRIMSMYASCVEKMLTEYANKRDEHGTDFFPGLNDAHNCTESESSIEKEVINIYIASLEEKFPNNKFSNAGEEDYAYAYISSNLNWPNIHLKPIVANYSVINKNTNSIIDAIAYNAECGVSEYNSYRLNCKTSKNKKLVKTFDSIKSQYWPENQIIYLVPLSESFTNNSSTIRTDMSEPLGNVYRWQPVINAMTCINNNIEEITIEGNIDRSFNQSNYSLQKSNTFYSTTDKSTIIPLYLNSNDSYEDNLQTKYYYEDKSYYNNDKRFTINEFAGSTTHGGSASILSSGYSVMYTTPSKNNDEFGTSNNFKFFNINDNNLNSYGKLFNRVPTIQDCENGVAYNYSNIPNNGNISSNKSDIEIIDDGNKNNATPFVRTTHYLYFKTYINTTFVMTVEASVSNNYDCQYTKDSEGNEKHSSHTTSSSEGTFYFNGNALQSEKCFIKFGNINDGLSRVYDEDNKGWGRCLSAEDITSRQIKQDGIIGDKNPSGGIEVPILVRYTPLLQPKLISESGKDINTGKEIVLESGNKNVTLINDRNTVKVQFANGNAASDSITSVKMSSFDLNVCYPFIPENNTYMTKSPNGGVAGSGAGVYYREYYYDSDSYPENAPDSNNNSLEVRNMDFLGGYGICTAYTVLLVPNNLNIKKDSNTLNSYLYNNDGKFAYFKQRANYYKDVDIYSQTASNSTSAGPVLVAYEYQANRQDAANYLSNGISFNKEKWGNGLVKGRNFIPIPIDFTEIQKGNYLYKNKDYADHKIFDLDSSNVLQTGVIYDLVIIPVYSNSTIKTYNYNETSPGTINNSLYGGGHNEENVHLAGSNPLVLFNYLQISNEVIENTIDNGSVPNPTPGDDDKIDYSRIFNSDPLIVFPNVDNATFNSKSGNIKECPGFWLNNSFRLILRMPSFRTNKTRLNKSDANTIENMSNGYLTSKNSPNDFRFEDIQIHIGKITELTEYGYPNNMDLNLNKLTSKEDLAKAHIISYKHYSSSGVFSKKLTEDTTDSRDLLTAGSLDNDNANYKNRFIEVNLSNAKIWDETKNSLVPIYTKYPEGYYIQFRWKSVYGSGTSEAQWSNWIGGSYDGGSHWWGTDGVNYFVPIRNYSDIHTDFRNYIKESYPGSLICSTNDEFTHNVIGKGSLMSHGTTNSDSKIKPKEPINLGYYHIGNGNMLSDMSNVSNKNDTMIVPDASGVNITETLSDKGIELSKNTDSYVSQYVTSYNTAFAIPENITNLHQNMWEMLYVDYIVRNMCKLYYKPNYNDNKDRYKSTVLYYHSAVPKILELIKYTNSENKDVSDILTAGNNKYYRKPITKKDFDDLNSQLKNLVSFIRDNTFSSNDDIVKNDPVNGIKDVLPVSENELKFDIADKLLIGSQLDTTPGSGNINNINHTLMGSNYIQHIWQNILSICKPGIYGGINNTLQTVDVDESTDKRS